MIQIVFCVLCFVVFGLWFGVQGSGFGVLGFGFWAKKLGFALITIKSSGKEMVGGGGRGKED